MNSATAQPLETKSELRAQIALAIPLAAQQLGFQLMGTVDAAWLGHYDETALAAAGIGNNLLFAVTSIGMGIVMGLDSVVPVAIGAGRKEDARRLLHAGLRLAVIVGLACTALVCVSPVILTLVGVDEEVARAARAYTFLRAVGVVPFLMSVALRSYLAACGITRPLVLVVIAGNVANFFLDWVLIFGISAIGLPPLGVIGAALATIALQALILVVYFAAVRVADAGVPLPRATREDVREVLRFGIPVGGQLFAEVGIFGVTTILAAYLGRLPVAAHTIALNLCSFTFSVAIGIGAATSVRVGHAVGAGDIALARRRGMIGFAAGLAIMSCFALLLLAVPSQIAGLLTNQPAAIAATVPLLLIAAIFQLSDGTQAIGSGALRGLGDTRATFVGNVVGHYGVGLGISLGLCFGADMGVEGLWWGLSAGLTVTATYLFVRFRIRTESPR